MNHRGLTYIEAIAATTIFVVVVLAVAITITQASNSSWLRVGTQFDSQLQAQKVLDRLGDELREAVAGVVVVQGVPTPSPATCGPSCVQFVRFISQPDGSSLPYTIVYTLNGNQQLIRQQNGKADEVVASGLQTFQPTCGADGLVRLVVSTQARSLPVMYQRAGWQVAQQLVSHVWVKVQSQ